MELFLNIVQQQPALRFEIIEELVTADEERSPYSAMFNRCTDLLEKYAKASQVTRQSGLHHGKNTIQPLIQTHGGN